MTDFVRLTIVQHPPVFLDTAASVEAACRYIADAADADLIVFPETWLPGYPVWLDEAPGAAMWGSAEATAVWRRLHQNAVVLGDAHMQTLQAAARAANAQVVMGMHERLGGTLYNTMAFIASDGSLAGIHRKLMPTYNEKLVWGMGDGSTLTVIDSPIGRVGGLVCWEHWMPLARFAMHQQQEQIHVAQWPTVRDVHQVASRSYAFEGQCFVAAAGTVLKMSDLAHLDLALLQSIDKAPDAFLQRGGSAIIAPDGRYVVEPLFEECGLISAEIDLNECIDGRLTLDSVGHYHRPDIFSLSIDKTDRLS